MTTRLKAGAAALLAAVAVAGTAVPSSAATVRRQLNAQYNRYVRAVENKDVDSILALTTPDFTMRLPNGTVLNRSQARANLEQAVQRSSILRSFYLEFTINSLRRSGSREIASVTQSGGGIVQAAHGRTHRVTESTRSRDTWVDTSGGWKMEHSDILGTTATMDGRTLQR